MKNHFLDTAQNQGITLFVGKWSSVATSPLVLYLYNFVFKPFLLFISFISYRPGELQLVNKASLCLPAGLCE